MKKYAKFLLLLLLAVIITTAAACDKKPVQTNERAVYDLSIELSGDQLTGCMELQFTNPLDTELTELKFALFANAYAPTATAADEEGKAEQTAPDYPLTMTAVTIAGKPLSVAYEYDNQLAVTTLPDPLAAGETTFVSIDYTLAIPEGNNRLGMTKNGVNLANCYPQLCVLQNGEWLTNPYYALSDPFVFHCADYYVTLCYTGDYTAAYSGKATDSYNKGGAKYVEIEGECMREFSAVLTDKGTALSERVGDVDVIYTYFDDDSPATTLATATLALKTFNEAFGDYPYPTLTVAQADFAEGGMEYPSLVYVSKTDAYDVYLNAVVHEIAHQWWYAIVGNNQVTAPWLDEGLAEFSAALFHRLNGNEAGYDAAVSTALARYTAVAEAAEKQNIDISSMRVALPDYPSVAVYVALSYDKGLLMWDTLLDCIGEKAVLKALRCYVEDNAFTIADEADLMAALDKQKKGASAILLSWLNGSVVIGK